MKNIKIVPYNGSKRCCDCGRISSYVIKKDGFQFVVCRDCVSNFEEEEKDD